MESLNVSVFSQLNKISISANAGVGNTIINATIWSDETYKSSSLLGNLNSYLEGTSNLEEFEVLLDDFEISKDTNLIFIEVESSDDTTLIKHVYSVENFRKCSLDKLLINLSNDECIDIVKKEVLNIDVLISSLIYSLDYGYYDKSIIIFDMLVELCEPACETCPQFKYLS